MMYNLATEITYNPLTKNTCYTPYVHHIHLPSTVLTHVGTCDNFYISEGGISPWLKVNKSVQIS